MSTRRSGRRLADTQLPEEELRRELSVSIPFGQQSRYDAALSHHNTINPPPHMVIAERFVVARVACRMLPRCTAMPLRRLSLLTPCHLTRRSRSEWAPCGCCCVMTDHTRAHLPPPLSLSLSIHQVGAKTCLQGGSWDASWVCQPITISNIVCGHVGTLAFTSPTYSVQEDAGYVRLTVSRSGGGHKSTSVECVFPLSALCSVLCSVPHTHTRYTRYSFEHKTSSDSDVTATAFYTTVQRIVFDANVITASFLITINDDLFLENDEQVSHNQSTHHDLTTPHAHITFTHHCSLF